MANIHVNFSNGDDSTGDGSIGNPYKTINKFFAVGNGGDTLYLADNVAHVMSSTISLATFGTTTPLSAANPIKIMPYHVTGGTLKTKTASSRTTGITGATIDGDGIVTNFGSNIDFIHLYGLKFIGFTERAIFFDDNTSIISCEATDPSGSTLTLAGVQVDLYGHIEDCYIHSTGTANASIFAGNQTFISKNFIDFDGTNSGVAVVRAGSTTVISGNLIYCHNGLAYDLLSCSNGTRILNNTFVGDGTSGQLGLKTSSNTISVINNIFANVTTGFNPTTSADIMHAVGANGFYNVTTKYGANLNSIGNDIRSLDITETADPFNNVGTLDFSLKSTSTFVNEGFGVR